MLAAIRKFARSWIALLLFAPLLVGFAIFGINGDLLRGAASSYVVKAGSRTVSTAEFKRDFDRQKKELEARFQTQIPIEMAIARGVDTQMLEELAFRESLNAMFERMGLRASDRMVKDRLREIPAFFDPVTGQFDRTRYVQALGERGFTDTAFEAIMRDEMRGSQFATAAAAGLRPPRAYSAMAALFALEERDLAYFVIDPKAVGAVAQPTDAEVQAFVKENAARFTLPEFRTISVARFSNRDFEGQIAVDPAEVQRRFDFQKDSLSRPELRTVVQIPVKSAAEAAQVGARLKAGEDPAAVAAAIKATPVRYDDKPRSAFFDPAIAGAAFATPAGGVSAPVKGQFGLAIVKVVSVTPGKTATLDEHRQEIEAKIRADLTAQKVSAMLDEYADAHDSGAALAEAARRAGAPVTVFGPVTADGRGLDARPVAGLSPEVLKAAFELPQGGESDIVQIGEGESIAVRVDKVTPPAMPPLAQVREQAIRIMVAQRQDQKLRARADELMARLRKGESVETVAAAVGARVVRVAAISRATLQTHQALGRELVGGALAAKKGEPFLARLPNTAGVVVATVVAVRTGDPQRAAQATEQGRMQFGQELFGEIGEAARGYARTKLKTKTNPDLAKRALGVDPAAQAGAGGKPAGKGK